MSMIRLACLNSWNTQSRFQYGRPQKLQIASDNSVGVSIVWLRANSFEYERMASIACSLLSCAGPSHEIT
jgi:hypothetical protein